jgi:alpha-galactosidase
MLVWSPDETPEGAARPILNALFGVIQYSMVLQRLPESHRRVMRHWIGFAERHRETLQQGEFRPYHPELNYTLMEAESDRERIIAVYAEDTLVRAGKSDKDVYVVNATYSESLPFRLSADAEIETFDVFGSPVGKVRFAAGLADVAVPPSGYAKVVWKR